MAPCCAGSKSAKTDWSNSIFQTRKPAKGHDLGGLESVFLKSGRLPDRQSIWRSRKWPTLQSSSSSRLAALARPEKAGMPFRSKWEAEEVPLCAIRLSDSPTHHARDSGATSSDVRPTSLCLDSRRQPQPIRGQQRPGRHWDDSGHKDRDGIQCRILERLLRLRPYPARKRRQ